MAQKISSTIGSLCGDKYSVWYFIIYTFYHRKTSNYKNNTGRLVLKKMFFSALASKLNTGLVNKG